MARKATAAEVIGWIESNLVVPQGPLAGQPFRTMPWQRRFIRGMLSRPRSGLSVGRGNGKTCLISAIAAAALVPGAPLSEPMAEVIVTASSFDQGRITVNLLRAMLDGRLEDRKAFLMQDSGNKTEVRAKANGVVLKVLGSDARRMHGRAPKLCLVDEPSQMPQGGEPQLAALSTAAGKIADAHMVLFGTRPDDPGHAFERWLADPDNYGQVHAGDGEAPLTMSSIRKANPSLARMPHLRAAILAERAQARRDPMLLPSFRALRVNLGEGDTSVEHVIASETWREAEGDVERSGPFILGIDTADTGMAAAIAYWPRSGRLEGFGAFCAVPTLAQRRDGSGGINYGLMHERSELIVVGGRVIDLPAMLREGLARWGIPRLIVSDAWRANLIRDALDASGCPRVEYVVRRNGPHDGSEDLRDFRRAVLGGAVIPHESYLLRSAFAKAQTTSDASGNVRLASRGERREVGRDDAAAASILAVAEGHRRYGNRPQRRRGRAVAQV